MAFPVTSPGPLLPLDAPLPQPRRYTLLDAANQAPAINERWMAGAWINDYPAGRPQTHDPCSTGTFRLKAADSGTARPMVSAFTVVIGGSCTAKSIGPDAGWYTDRLTLAFQARESEAVERVLITGDHHAGVLGAYVGDSNMDAPAGATAQTRREGLAILENEIALVGNGIIHATPALAALWAGDYLIGVERGQMRTLGNGTLVAVGSGYIGTAPDAYQAPLGAGQEWAYATGFIDYHSDDLTILPGQYAQALDRSDNQVTFYAERDYLLSLVLRQDSSDDDHIQAGVKIDRTS